ncbi:MAG TPA: glycosyltransferase [Candidatus Baltobacteraceae bacterium]|nr:glycosyltransferase [Candidatus Baltobacteraceae bacterium]
MPDRPLFSVVIPAYNCAPYVGQAIRSVLRQTIARSDVEIVVLDDGSVDGTQAVIERFGDAVRFVQLAHGGVSRARNVGIEAARGTYVAFLDADDFWLPERLAHAAAVLSVERRVFANTEFYVETAGVRAERPYYRSRGLTCLFELPAPAQLAFALEDNFISSMTIVPRDALVKAGGFNTSLRYGEDWDLWLRLLDAGYAVRLSPEADAVYRYQRPGSTTTHTSSAKARDRLFVLSQHRSEVSDRRWEQAQKLTRRLALRERIGKMISVS